MSLCNNSEQLLKIHLHIQRVTIVSRYMVTCPLNLFSRVFLTGSKFSGSRAYIRI